MRSPARPFFHASAAVPLTGREPVLGRLRGRLEHRGQGWGRVILTGPRGAGISRLLDECERGLGDGRPPLRVRPTVADAPAFEPLRRAFLARFGRATRDEVQSALPDGAPVAWLLDGPLVGAEAPDVGELRELLAAIQAAGPILVDDLARLDAGCRALLLEEGEARGIGLLAGDSTVDVEPTEAHWPLEALGETQIELLLRRWLRHPVATRRLTPLLLDHTGGWPGRVVRAIRRMGRAGALEETARGVAVTAWPPPIDADPVSFPAWVASQPSDVRRLLTVAAVQGDPDDDHFLARAASVRLRVVTDTREEVAEVFPEACGGLFPTPGAQRALLDEVDPPIRDDTSRSLNRTWSRRREEREPRAAARASRLRVALQGGDAGAAGTALARFLACLPADAVPAPEGRALIEAALEVVPSEAAQAVLARPRVASRASRHEALAERALRRGRPRARAAHLRRAAKLHRARGAVRAAGRALLALGATEREAGRIRRGFDAYLDAARLHEAVDDDAFAAAAQHAAADLAVELANYDQAVDLLEACLRGGVDTPAVRASLARARHGRGDLETAEGDTETSSRLADARRLILDGRDDEGRALLAQLADDPQLRTDVRVAALVRLTHALLRAGDEAGAHEAACRADALLEVGRRSRAHDASLHHQLAVAFRALGEMGRAIRHRRASRTARRRGGGQATLTTHA